MSDLVFMGPPGAGKGTISKILQNAGLAEHISTGEIIREYLTTLPDTDPLHARIAEGKFLNDDEITALLIRRVEQAKLPRVIFDGYPRNVEQIVLLDKILERSSRQLRFAVLFEMGDDKVISRISERYNCRVCLHVYHKTFNPAPQGVCQCGSKEFEVRADDRPEVVGERLKRYHTLTEPLIEHYEYRGVLRIVNADQEIEAVMSDVMDLGC
jgi:adenylate kinase